MRALLLRDTGGPSGGFAERVMAPAFLVFDIPDALGDEAAAGFFVNHQTAQLALKVRRDG